MVLFTRRKICQIRQRHRTFTDMIGERAMAYYLDTSTSGTPELNYYYFIASQFAFSDRWFSPVSSKTIPNRLATMSGGTTQGYVLIRAMTITRPSSLPRPSSSCWMNTASPGRFTIRPRIPTGAQPPPSSTSATAEVHFQELLRRHHCGRTHIAPISQFTADAQNKTLARVFLY